MKRTATFNLYGKPSERLILIAICEKYECEFTYDEATGFASILGEAESVSNARQFYNEVIAIAYKQLAFAQAKSTFAKVSNKTLVSEFMAGFANVIVSMISGNMVMFHANTEVKRAGIRAAIEAEEWAKN